MQCPFQKTESTVKVVSINWRKSRSNEACAISSPIHTQYPAWPAFAVTISFSFDVSAAYRARACPAVDLKVAYPLAGKSPAAETMNRNKQTPKTVDGSSDDSNQIPPAPWTKVSTVDLEATCWFCTEW